MQPLQRAKCVAIAALWMAVSSCGSAEPSAHGPAVAARSTASAAASAPPPSPRALSYWSGAFASEHARAAFEAARPWTQRSCGPVAGVIVPHHLVAAPLIAAALAGVTQPVRTVVLLVPDHRNLSPHQVSTSLAHWRTAAGRIEPATELAQALIDEGLIAIDERGFAMEHAVADVVPLLEQAFGPVRLLPLRFRSIDCREGLARARALGERLASHIGDETLLVASVDFVHDKPAAEAAELDRQSAQALASLEPARACEVEADSPLALATLLAAARQVGARRYVPLRRADSHLLGASSADEVVSYQTAYLNAVERQPVSLLALGDVMLGRAVTARMRQRDDFRYPLAQVAVPLEAADLVVANLEAQLVSDCPTLYRGLRLCADPRAIEALLHAGVDVVSIANNHAQDFGADGLAASVRLLRQRGIAVAGYDGAAMVERRGTRFAVLGYAAIKGPFSPRRMSEEIAAARQQADVVIAFMHWGREGRHEPSAMQRKLAAQAVRAGADLVLGAHPHALQPIESLGKATVAYSLGNFVFDQRSPPSTRRGAAGVFSFCGAELADAQLAPVRIDDTGAARFTISADARR